MPCDHFMPTYSPYGILLIANDRNAKYYSIRDDKYRIDEKDVDEVIGYVADKM